MKYRDIIVVATNSDKEPWRPDRLQRVLGYVCSLADIFGNAVVMGKVEKVRDHKGALEVYWHSQPTEEEREFFLKAWGSEIGDRSKIIQHSYPDMPIQAICNIYHFPPDISRFPQANVELCHNKNGELIDSPALFELLLESRSGYSWPNELGPNESQRWILNIEQEVECLLANLNADTAHRIVVQVSEWAGNNKPSHRKIIDASLEEKQQMRDALALLGEDESVKDGLKILYSLPGISLVIASKIFRFCCPTRGAAIDRHTSYFFNSLPVIGSGHPGPQTACGFKREWSKGENGPTRLATFRDNVLQHNEFEYRTFYLPLLKSIANRLNQSERQYICAATGQTKNWRPTDVEMAAYFWWANHGPN